MDAHQKHIPPARKALYYGGMALAGVGGLLFLSTFLTGIANFGNFETRAKSEAFRAFGGIVLMGIGCFMMNVGALGWAGSGIVLDPERGRKDVEPWSRMGGGIAQDALSEIDIVKKIEKRFDTPEPRIKVRCQKCQALNDETAKFCNQCGSAI